MSDKRNLFLYKMASKYIWWHSADTSMNFPDKIICQTMNLGNLEDMLELKKLYGSDELKNILLNSLCGQFSEKSWYYWLCMLGLPDNSPRKTRFSI